MCAECGLEVRESDARRGGLGPCIPGRWKVKNPVDDDLSALVTCKNCKKLVPNTTFCLSCAAQMHPLNWVPGAVLRGG